MINWASKTADSIAELRTFPGVIGTASRFRVLGHTTANNGGGGVFYWRSGTPPADDNGINVVVSGITSGWWQRSFTGDIFPRYFGAVGNDATDDSVPLQAAINYAAPLKAIVNGEGRSYKMGGLNLLEDTILRNCEFRMTAGTYGAKINNVGDPATVYKRNVMLRDVIFKGQCTYALIISTITNVNLQNVIFRNCTCTNDVFYLLNVYDSEITKLTFTGCTAGVDGACLNIAGGLNGVRISRIYTSSFTDRGVNIAGGAGITLSDSVIQGATTGIYITKCRGASVLNPYFENVVNPAVLTNEGSDVDNIGFYGGYWGGPYGSHPALAQDNGVMLRYYGATHSVSMTGGKYDVSTSGKKLCCVGGAGIINITRPTLSTGLSTPELTDYLFKESTALSTAGYNALYVRPGNASTTVSRTGAIANGHVVEYYDSSYNLLRSRWSPTNVGTSAASLLFSANTINATPKTGSYTLSASDEMILFDTSSFDLTATLPATVPTGKRFIIKKTAAPNKVNITVVDGVITIDGSTIFSLNGQNDVATLEFDGSKYLIVNAYLAGGKFNIIGASVSTTSLQTNTYMNTNYPAAAIGDKYIFTNLSDAPGNVATVRKYTSTNWFSKIDYVKNS